LFNNLSDNLR